MNSDSNDTIEVIWRNVWMVVPIQYNDLDRVCYEEWDELLKCRFEKLVVSVKSYV